MEKTLEVINRMEADGVIGRYAIGGAIAAIFYVEPFATYDIDIFITFSASQTDLLTLTPIYDYLAERGYTAENEAILIEGWAVQFLPVFNPLLEEALEQAKEIEFENVPTRIFQSEHLMAVMLQTGRAKDYARIIKFMEEQVFDQLTLAAILQRYGMTDQWEEFLTRFKLRDP